MPIRTLIVDDEPLARLGLSRLLADEPDFLQVGEAGDAGSARAALQRLQPELLLLDVQMPGGSGMDLLDALDPAQRPEVVFVTAHEQFARRAFDARALDYLLKPFRRERFRQALERVRERRRGAAGPDRLLVRSAGRYLLVDLEEIDHVSAAGNYVVLHGAAGTQTVRETMAGLEERLPSARFVRIHRSHLVALQALRALQPVGDGEFVAVLRGGRELPVGERYATALRARLGIR